MYKLIFGCLDINECLNVDSSTGPCSNNSVCINNLGSYGCLCEKGYHGDGLVSGKGCVNDNECSEAARKFIIYNQFNSGFRKQVFYHEYSIYFTDVCQGANTRCEDSIGSYSCLCIDGYTGDGVTCTDIDECTENTHNCSTINVINGTAVSKF